ncbi:MAG: SMP-30/gluconolactonase/LRE family protein, partial [Saprospiraceae bacterium]|nr:SMP-30/gluconolactonase/LRE family protein [Saprospiraceae bacterium]
MKKTDYSLPDPEQVQPHVIFDHTYYTEGPVVDAAGHLYFTDLAGKSIWHWKDNIPQIWAKGVRPNGQALMLDGSLMVCDSGAACIVHYDVEGRIQKKMGAGLIGNIRVRCPNDIAIDLNHGIYFTDSVRHEGAVFFIGFSGNKKLVADQIDFANGIGLSPDGLTLFVAESYRNRILIMDLDGPGQAKSKKVFADLPVNAN